MLRVLDADEVGGRIGYDSAGTPGFSLRDSVLNLPTDIHSLFVNQGELILLLLSLSLSRSLSLSLAPPPPKQTCSRSKRDLLLLEFLAASCGDTRQRWHQLPHSANALGLPRWPPTPLRIIGRRALTRRAPARTSWPRARFSLLTVNKNFSLSLSLLSLSVSLSLSLSLSVCLCVCLSVCLSLARALMVAAAGYQIACAASRGTCPAPGLMLTIIKVHGAELCVFLEEQ